jgi:hypothetical protein
MAASLNRRSRAAARIGRRAQNSCLISLLLFGLHFAVAQSPSATINTVRGVVLNSVTREPVARALVTSGDNSFAALTDDQGRFSFTVPGIATESSGGVTVSGLSGFNLHAGKPGFLDDDGSNAMASTSPNSDLVFTLTPESLIIGRVALPSAGSFDRISVELYRRQIIDGRGRWLPAGTERARSNGDFRFSNLAAGTYKLFTGELLDRDPLTADNDPDGPQVGYPPTYFPTASDFGSATPIILAAGQTFQAELTPTLHPYYTIKITMPNARPGEGVNVTVAAANHHGPGFSLGYNGQNQAIEGMLPSGTYTVEAVSYGATPTSGVLTLTVRNGPVLTPTLVLLPSQTIPVSVKEEFTLAENNPGSGVNIGSNFGGSGTHVFRRRYPTINASLVPADDFSPHPGATGRTAGNGDASLALTGAIPGRYWLQINAPRGYVASATSAGVDLLLNPLIVGPGGASAPIDIALRDDTAEIDGTIEDSAPAKTGRGQLPAVYCVPLPDSAGTFQQANVQTQPGEDLKFQCPILAPGSYRVLAFEHSQPDLEYRNPEAMRPYESKGPVVRITGGQKESVRVPRYQP